MTIYNLGRVKGEKGDKGDKGEKGDKGDKGEKGDTGTIILDNTVTQSSLNAVKSSGIYAALTGKADSSHNHTISDVNNLQSTLDGKVNGSDIVDNVTTADASKPLSAKQGKVLYDLISGIEEDMLL